MQEQHSDIEQFEKGENPESQNLTSHNKLKSFIAGFSIIAFCAIVFLAFQVAAMNSKATDLMEKNEELSLLYEANLEQVYAAGKKGAKNVYIVRDCETSFSKQPDVLRGTKNAILSDIGKENAKKMAQWMKDYKITKIYHSSDDSAYETAKYIKDVFPKAKMVEEKELLRDINWGKWQGHYSGDVFKGMKFGNFDYNIQVIDIPKGESFYGVLDRVRKTMWKILNEEDENVVIVTHQNWIQMFGLWMMDAPMTKYWTFYPNECTISKIAFKDMDDARIKFWNTKFYLE